jgi:hypothetical protein
MFTADQTVSFEANISEVHLAACSRAADEANLPKVDIRHQPIQNGVRMVLPLYWLLVKPVYVVGQSAGRAPISTDFGCRM